MEEGIPLGHLTAKIMGSTLVAKVRGYQSVYRNTDSAQIHPDVARTMHYFMMKKNHDVKLSATQ